ncbi:MAG: polysaccharide biosynthesis tyrosine autokinase [Anaerolineae bacterium]|nr:polysaccharide biosynthesis tyrosine autokinase [Anaerolineae bacterium]
MQLVDYLNILNRRKGVIFATLVFTLLIIIVGVTQIPPKYTATGTIRILTARTGGADYVDYDIEYAKRLVGTYAEIAVSDPVLSKLAEYVTPLPKISVEIISETELFTISAEDVDPDVAQFTVNKLAEILILQSREVYGSDANIYLVEPASLPDEPSSASPLLVVGLGLAMALLVGIGLAFIFENLDTRIYTPNEMRQAAHLPLLGDIGTSQHENELLVNQPILAEAFRRLRTNVFSPKDHRAYKTFLVTSPVPKDGRSTIAANLGVIAGQSGRKVIIVDADLRSPSQHKIFNVENEIGLNDLLNGSSRLADAIQTTMHPNVDLLPSGLPPYNPEALDSENMLRLLETLKENYDVVLVDAHSSFSVTDPAVLAPKVDSVLLVMRFGWDRKEVLQATLTHLEQVDANVLGIVANRTHLGSHSRKVRIS